MVTRISWGVGAQVPSRSKLLDRSCVAVAYGTLLFFTEDDAAWIVLAWCSSVLSEVLWRYCGRNWGADWSWLSAWSPGDIIRRYTAAACCTHPSCGVSGCPCPCTSCCTFRNGTASTGSPGLTTNASSASMIHLKCRGWKRSVIGPRLGETVMTEACVNFKSTDDRRTRSPRQIVCLYCVCVHEELMLRSRAVKVFYSVSTVNLLI